MKEGHALLFQRHKISGHVNQVSPPIIQLVDNCRIIYHFSDIPSFTAFEYNIDRFVFIRQVSNASSKLKLHSTNYFYCRTHSMKEVGVCRGQNAGHDQNKYRKLGPSKRMSK